MLQQVLLMLQIVYFLYLIVSSQKELSNEKESGKIKRLKAQIIIGVFGIICGLSALFIGFGL